jgi:hypothetical protein
MVIGELLEREWRRTSFCNIGVCRTRNQPPRLRAPQLQIDVSCDLIGCIFLASQHRHVQHIEQRMGEFVQRGVKEGTYNRVDRHDAGGGRLRRHALPQLIDILVTNGYCVIQIGCISFTIASC